MNDSLMGPAMVAIFPFLAFVVGAFGAKKYTRACVFFSCASIGASFFLAAGFFGDFFLRSGPPRGPLHQTFTWFDLSAMGEVFPVNMGIYLDHLSVIMLLMVTAVAALIHIFSTYYMKDDPRYGRFFVYLSLFTSAMLGLVLSDNLLSVFIFWELMGFCSYGLIGFYYEKEGAGDAALKAFMTTRVGDVFFLLAIAALWAHLGSVSFVELYQAIEAQAIPAPLATFVGLCLLVATMGKSAQVPLHVWLPDAMWGPTPCSALIHAATMVAAGVYLSLRAFPLLELGGLLPAMAYVGSITAILAAIMALAQTDLKAVLAYSTISQLGYMVLGIGVGGYTPAFMHLITHAVFKACLFLSAGSIIHSLHAQDMFKMGGLSKKLPFTFVSMLFCFAAISGIPLWAGFVSKDRILGQALLAAGQNPALWVPAIFGFVAAFLTALYMGRMMCLVFLGTPKDPQLYQHLPKETLSWNRNVPLMALAVFTLGFWYSGHFFGGWGPWPLWGEWFQKAVFPPGAIMGEVAHGPLLGEILSIILACAGVAMAWWWYAFHGGKTLRSVILENRYYFDWLYLEGFIKRALMPLGQALARFDLGVFDRYAVDGWKAVNQALCQASDWFDRRLIDQAMVDGAGFGARLFNVALRMLQTGRIQFYFLVLFIVLIGYVFSLKIFV